MTTLILLCLALIGAGVLLFASQQVRAQIVGGLSLKLLCLVMIGCMILPVAQVQAEAHDEIHHGYNYEPQVQEEAHDELNEHKYEPIPLHLLDITKIDKGSPDLRSSKGTFVVAMINAATFMVANCLTSRGQGKYMPPPPYLGSTERKPLYVHTSGQCGDAYDDYIVGHALLKEWDAAMDTREIRRDAKQKIAALKDKLKSKQFCDVVLEGTILLREVQDHNDRGLGTKGEAARIPDGELHGIIEVAKQGCNPE